MLRCRVLGVSAKFLLDMLFAMPLNDRCVRCCIPIVGWRGRRSDFPESVTPRRSRHTFRYAGLRPVRRSVGKWWTTGVRSRRSARHAVCPPWKRRSAVLSRHRLTPIHSRCESASSGQSSRKPARFSTSVCLEPRASAAIESFSAAVFVWFAGLRCCSARRGVCCGGPHRSRLETRQEV